MNEGEFKKRLEKLLSPEIRRWNPEVLDLVDEARKEFLKDFTDDNFFVLKEYGLEDNAKLTTDAMRLKNEILIRWGKQSAIVFLKWFGSGDKKDV